MPTHFLAVYFAEVQFLYPPSEQSETGRYTVFTSCVSVCPSIHVHLVFRYKYLENGLRYRIGTNYPLLASWMTSQTFKGQGHDHNIFKAHYFENGSR